MSDVPPRIDPAAVRSAQFQGSFRKYDSKAVDQYLTALADQLVQVNNHIDELERQVAAAPRVEARSAEPEPTPTPAAAPAEKPDLQTLTDDEIATLVGEETAHVLATARRAAEEIRTKAEESAARMIRESTDEAASVAEQARTDADELRREAEEVRATATAEADAEAQEILDRARADAERRVSEARAMADDEVVRAERLRAEADEDAENIRTDAREEGRAMLAEAKDVRSRVLEDLQRRRDLGRSQIERLVAGRDRLLEAYAAVRENVDGMTADLHHVLDEPFEHDPALEEGFVGIVTTSAPPTEPEPETDDEVDAEAEAPTSDGEPATTPTSGAGTPAEVTSAPDDGGSSETADTPSAEDAVVAPMSGVPATEEVASAPDDAESAADLTPSPEPDVAAEAETETEPAAGDGDGDVEVDEDTDTDDADTDDTGTDDKVDADELFARMRAEREQSVARAQAVLSSVDGDDESEGDDVDEAAPAADTVDDADGADNQSAETEPAALDAVPAEYLASGAGYEHRTEVLAEATKSLSRSLKRLLADEQNEVLDGVRRTESTELAEVLPAADEHAASYAEVAEPILVDLARSAAAHVDPSADSVDVTDLAFGLGSSLVEPLRRRIERAAADVDGDHEELDERLRSLYREWKVEQIGRLAADALVSAYALGQVSAAPEGASVRWLIDPATGPCPDCQDNALEGAIAVGEAFPTGDVRPQAHPGCSCMLAVDQRPAAT